MGHREQLLQAARRMLETKGYAHTTTRDLVAESNTNLASIGYHFGSKAGLLNAAIATVFQEWTDQLAAIAMAEPGVVPLERARITWVAVLDSFAGKRAFLLSYVEALAQAERSPELREQVAGQYRRCRAQIAELVARSFVGEISASDPRSSAIASFVIAVCDGLALQFLLDPDGLPTGADLTAGLQAAWSASTS
ncbi:MAG: TetR family transcriptional regulator C-terminal domain-containing protein [Actinomycetota bacterium]|nr:TetR family transcriptional regulator C-terminal domain-containing protein [Actinomycetota bacterium]MDQ2957712.1 TetR family transcriptional regulator C-terminal domain-containing protein [Actinomycetota bacterium]